MWESCVVSKTRLESERTMMHLFNVSGLGMEYSAIIQNLVMLGVTPMQVGVEEEGEE